MSIESVMGPALDGDSRWYATPSKSVNVWSTEDGFSNFSRRTSRMMMFSVPSMIILARYFGRKTLGASCLVSGLLESMNSFVYSIGSVRDRLLIRGVEVFE